MAYSDDELLLLASLPQMIGRRQYQPHDGTAAVEVPVLPTIDAGVGRDGTQLAQALPSYPNSYPN